MPKLALFTPTFYPSNSGYANACTELALALNEIPDVELAVHVALSPAGAHEDGRFTVHPVLPDSATHLHPKIQWLYAQVRGIFRLRKLLADPSIDLVLVETFELSPAIYFSTLGQSWDTLRRLIVRVHAVNETEMFTFARHPVFRILFWFARRAARNLPNIASTSSYYIQFLKQHWFDGNSLETFRNFVVIPNTMRPPALRPTADSNLQKAEFLVLGRMNPAGYNQKNFELIAEAVHLISRTDTELFRRLHITVIGDGDMLERFRTMLDGLEIGKAFTIMSRLPNTEVRRLQRSCTAALLVSRYEGISMFALECVAAGTPLIVSTDTALDDLVQHNVSGLKVSSSNAAELADAIADLLRADLNAFSTNARAIFDARFSPAVVTSRLLTFMKFARHSVKPRHL